MANIPQSPEPSAVSEGLPTPYDQNRVTPDSVGIGNALGQAANNVGALTAQIAERAQERARVSAVADGEAKIQAGLNSLGLDRTIIPGTEQKNALGGVVPGTGQPKGFLLQQGDNAQRAYQPTLDQADKLVADEINNASDPEVKRLLTMRAPALLNDFKRTAAIHVGQQIEVLNNKALEARVAVGIDAAVNDFADPVGRAQALSKLKSWAMVGAQQQGDADGGDFRWLRIQKEVAQQTLQQMLALPDDQFPNKGDLAKKYLDSPMVEGGKSAREILGSDGTHLIAQVGAVNEAAAAETKAQSFFAKRQVSEVPNALPLPGDESVYRNDGSGRVDRGALIAKIDGEIPPGQYRDQVLSRAFRKATEINEGWRDQAQELASGVLDKAIDPATGRVDLNLAPADEVKQLQQKWPERYEGLLRQTYRTNRLRENAQSRATDAARDQADLDGYRNAWTALNDADEYEKTAQMSDAQFKGQFKGTMNDKQWQSIYSKFQSVHGQLNRPPPDALLIGEARDALGLGDAQSLREMAPEQLDPVMQLSEAVTRRLAAERAALGPKAAKDLSPERQRQIIAEEIARIPTPGTGWGRYDLFPDSRFRFEIDNETAHEAQRATAELPLPDVDGAPATAGASRGSSAELLPLPDPSDLDEAVPAGSDEPIRDDAERPDSDGGEMDDYRESERRDAARRKGKR